MPTTLEEDIFYAMCNPGCFKITYIDTDEKTAKARAQLFKETMTKLGVIVHPTIPKKYPHGETND